MSDVLQVPEGSLRDPGDVIAVKRQNAEFGQACQSISLHALQFVETYDTGRKGRGRL